MDYDLQRCTRHCATSGRELSPGEAFYSTLTSEGSNLVRRDFAVEAWQGPPEGVVGWWKSRMPDPTAKKARMAPNDVLLELFDQWEHDPNQEDIRYVLVLLLVRRRVMRVEEQEVAEAGRSFTVLYCPRRETSYKVPIVVPDSERTAQIQEELSRLLFADAK
jgi:hypothetical protein